MTGIEDDPTLPDGAAPLFEEGTDDAPRVVGGRYTLEERLGTGGGAVVWRAFDETLSRTVAIKLLRPALAADPAAVARLRHEAAAAGRVPHPGIVAVYDVGTDPAAWLALEHVDGPTLLEVLRHHPRGLDPQVAASVAEQLADALGTAHARGLVHRDVKPSNVLLTREGVVKLADFGVAAAADDRAPELAGSRGYAPPEQLTGSAGADRPTVDVFTLGVLLHECLTGRPAFSGSGRRTRGSGELLSPRQVRADVPRDLDAIVRRATRSDPAVRYADATQMAAALRPLVATDPLELTRTLVVDGPGGRRGRAGAARGSSGAAASGASATPTATGPSGDRPPTPTPTPSTVDRGHPPADPGNGLRLRVAIAVVATLVAVGGLTRLAVIARDQPTDVPTATVDVGVPVTSIAVFDPYGSIAADDAVPAAAIDGDPTTAWRTPSYPVPLRSLGTPGLGIWLDVGEPRAVAAVALELATGGVTVELLAADTPPTAGSTEADWRSLDRAERPGERVDLAADGEVARYWLVWFTELEPVGETWQAALTDLRFRPAEDA